MYAWICVWFILGEGGEVFCLIGDVLGLNAGLESGWVEFGFVMTSSDGAF